MTKEEWIRLIDGRTQELAEFLFEKAREVRHAYYGKDVYIRGLIEFTNYCKNDCYYCGIRKSNHCVSRYRLTEEEILDCCRNGYHLGFRTFVLQGGEDGYFTKDRMTKLIQSIHTEFPDCAITLSVGEREKGEYEAYFKAGANRFLLRHETATDEHYRYLHPEELSLQDRKECLWNLRHIGYQVGSGIMVGSPGQTAEHLAEDLLFLQELQPHMVGIGPFIPHKDTPFSTFEKGSVEKTLMMLSLIRLMNENVLLPATTALATASDDGRIEGIKAGANVVMPNLSPENVRDKYALYDNKAKTGAESAEGLEILEECVKKADCHLDMGRGDSLVKG